MENTLNGKLYEEAVRALWENTKGSITGIYTVLVDGDDLNGPVPDLARGILDGHIVLKRELATISHYPAISVLDSVSRIMEEIVSSNHWQLANEMRKILSVYKENELYFKLGTIQENAENAYILNVKQSRRYKYVLKQGRSDSFQFDDIVEAMYHIV